MEQPLGSILKGSRVSAKGFLGGVWGFLSLRFRGLGFVVSLMASCSKKLLGSGISAFQYGPGVWGLALKGFEAYMARCLGA